MCKLTKETFIKVIQCLQKYEDFLDRLQDLHVNILDVGELFICDEVKDLLLKDFIGIKNLDIINDWFYEDGGRNASIEEIEEIYNKIEQC